LLTEPFTLARQRPESCLSDLVLDRLLAGELEGKPEMSTVRAHLASCAACATRLSEMESLSKDFAADELGLARAVSRTERALRGRSLRMGVAFGLIAAAAAVLLQVLPKQEQPGSERIKGSGVRLELMVRHLSGKVEPVLPGASLSPGEAVRFRVSSERTGSVAVVGLDAAQNVTAYMPNTGALP